MKSIEDYIYSLPKKGLNTGKISAVIYDNRIGYYLYLFKINLKEKSCIMMNGPSKKYDDYDSVGLTSLSIWQLNNHYGDCEIIKDHPYIGMTYQEVKTLL